MNGVRDRNSIQNTTAERQGVTPDLGYRVRNQTIFYLSHHYLFTSEQFFQRYQSMKELCIHTLQVNLADVRFGNRTALLLPLTIAGRPNNNYSKVGRHYFM